MKLVGGDVFSAVGVVDWLLIPTNAVVKYSGELVMGAGVAKLARDRYPGLALDLGSQLAQRGYGHYGVLISNIQDHGTYIGAFQSKLHWQEPSDAALIWSSLEKLADCLRDSPEPLYVAMPIPGIGLGGLPREEVMGMLELMPDTLWVYDLSLPASMAVTLYTDGAYSSKSGTMGSAWILQRGRIKKEYQITTEGGTSQRAEALAVLKGLESIKPQFRGITDLDVVSDSEWVLESLKLFLIGPKGCGIPWCSAYGKVTCNRDLLDPAVDLLKQFKSYRLIHTRGHNGHPENERCDELATVAAGTRK